MKWIHVVLIALLAATLVMAVFGQRHDVWTRIEGSVARGTLYSVHDTKNGIVCYGVEGYQPTSVNVSVAEAISCVKVTDGK